MCVFATFQSSALLFFPGRHRLFRHRHTGSGLGSGAADCAAGWAAAWTAAFGLQGGDRLGIIFKVHKGGHTCARGVRCRRANRSSIQAWVQGRVLLFWDNGCKAII